jgi:hypothetical protein
MLGNLKASATKEASTTEGELPLKGIRSKTKIVILRPSDKDVRRISTAVLGSISNSTF